VFEHLLSVPGQVFGIKHWRLNVVLGQEIEKPLLPLDLGKLAEVAITPKKVEGVEYEAVLITAGKFGLQFREVCSSLVDDHHFSVDDRLSRDIQGAGNLRKSFGPFQPVESVDLPLPLFR
jgi:hypothetical protein